MNFSSSMGILMSAGLLEALCFFLEGGILNFWEKKESKKREIESKWLAILTLVIEKGRRCDL